MVEILRGDDHVEYYKKHLENLPDNGNPIRKKNWRNLLLCVPGDSRITSKEVKKFIKGDRCSYNQLWSRLYQSLKIALAPSVLPNFSVFFLTSWKIFSCCCSEAPGIDSITRTLCITFSIMYASCICWGKCIKPLLGQIWSSLFMFVCLSLITDHTMNRKNLQYIATKEPSELANMVKSKVRVK